MELLGFQAGSPNSATRSADAMTPMRGRRVPSGGAVFRELR